MTRRFKALSRDIYEFVVTDDTFALEELPEKKKLREQGLNILQQKQKYLFMTNPQKIEEFNKWFLNRVDVNILAVEAGSGDPWTSKYVYDGYKQGVNRAYIDTHKAALAATPDYYAGTKEQFIRSTFGRPETVQKLKILGTRAFSQLKGISAQMSQDISRVLVDGLTQGQNPLKIARTMQKRVDYMSRVRARRIARTEIIYAHSEGQLDAFDLLGVKEVGVMAEWSTAGDDLVCVFCQDKEGQKFTIEEAHGEIPLHPNCRCAWIPYIPKQKKKFTSKPPKSPFPQPFVPKSGKTPSFINPDYKPYKKPKPKVVRPKKPRKPRAPAPNQIFTSGLSPDVAVSGKSFTVISENIGGSTGAKLVRVGDTKYIMKQYAKTDAPSLHAQNELIANRIIKKMGQTRGGRVPSSFLGKVQGEDALFTRYIDDVNIVGQSPQPWMIAKAEHDFVTNSWLANWDVAGMSIDNLGWKGKQLYYLDNGGAMVFRAQGGLKGNAWGKFVGELDTMRKGSTNPSAVKIFGNIDDEKLIKLIDTFEKKFNSQGGWKFIDDIVAQSNLNPIDEYALKNTLIGRYDDILKSRDTLRQQIAAKKLIAKQSAKARKAAKKTGMYTEVAPMREHAVFKQNLLTEKQKKAVRDFTGNQSGEINNKVIKDLTSGEAKSLNTAINECPKFNGMSFRGVRKYPGIEKEWKNWTDGSWGECWWKGFSSSSVESGRAFPSPDTGVFFIVKNRGKYGGYVQPVSAHTSENELLFNMGARFRVVGWSDEPHKVGGLLRNRTIILEETDDIPLSQLAPTRYKAREIQKIIKDAETLQGE